MVAVAVVLEELGVGVGGVGGVVGGVGVGAGTTVTDATATTAAATTTTRDCRPLWWWGECILTQTGQSFFRSIIIFFCSGQRI